MSPDAPSLLERLADGAVHSGQTLAAEFGVSRAAIGKRIARLRARGWPVEACRGAGYYLQSGSQPLDRAAIEGAPGYAIAAPETLELLEVVDSTSRHLDRGPAPARGRTRLCIAEHQQAGRGRQGRTWHSGAGVSITFSAVRTFDRSPVELGALGLAVGVALCECLASLGIGGIGLKWPNDLLHQGRKLGGILIELRGEAAGATRVTVGVGINYADPGTDTGTVTADLRSIAGEGIPDRSRVAGTLMGAVTAALDDFAASGFGAFRKRWGTFDLLAGRAVRVWTGQGTADGMACGIADNGALLFEDRDGRRHSLHSADVTIRARV
jgi:BirA family biotin operon repressor/biotin-[acetyl-CoA-carboxylase] ligase